MFILDRQITCPQVTKSRADGRGSRYFLNVEHTFTVITRGLEAWEVSPEPSSPMEYFRF